MTDSLPRVIKFVRAEVEVVPGAHCQALVEVEARGSEIFSGTAQGGLDQPDQLRAVARATSDALSAAFDTKGAQVRVRSVQLVEGVMQTVVVVFLTASKGTRTQSLLGVCDGTEDPTKATALAVLNATNRFLTRE